MSDKEGGAAAKRSKKTNEHDAGEHLARINHELAARNEELTVRNYELTSRNEELEARNDELESEIRVLRGEGKCGYDSLLPVVTTASIELSRVDPSLVAHVASFLGLSRELLSMALTCKAFGWRPPSASSSLGGSSLVEEAARQFLVNQLQPRDVERNLLPQYGNDTIAWLTILYELERLRLPLKFSKFVGCGMEHSGSESIVTSSSLDDYVISTALTDYVMKRGVHYASFKLISDRNAAELIVGVARPFRDFDFVMRKRDLICLMIGTLETFLHSELMHGWAMCTTVSFTALTALRIGLICRDTRRTTTRAIGGGDAVRVILLDCWLT